MKYVKGYDFSSTVEKMVYINRKCSKGVIKTVAEINFDLWEPLGVNTVNALNFTNPQFTYYKSSRPTKVWREGLRNE